jgi:hypothetical protein
VAGQGANTWRASLQSTATERIYHFATVEALFAFIAEQTQAAERPGVVVGQRVVDPAGAGLDLFVVLLDLARVEGCERALHPEGTRRAPRCNRG